MQNITQYTLRTNSQKDPLKKEPETSKEKTMLSIDEEISKFTKNFSILEKFKSKKELKTAAKEKRLSEEQRKLIFSFFRDNTKTRNYTEILLNDEKAYNPTAILFASTKLWELIQKHKRKDSSQEVALFSSLKSSDWNILIDFVYKSWDEINDKKSYTPTKFIHFWIITAVLELEELKKKSIDLFNAHKKEIVAKTEKHFFYNYFLAKFQSNPDPSQENLIRQFDSFIAIIRSKEKYRDEHLESLESEELCTFHLFIKNLSTIFPAVEPLFTASFKWIISTYNTIPIEKLTPIVSEAMGHPGLQNLLKEDSVTVNFNNSKEKYPRLLLVASSKYFYDPILKENSSEIHLEGAAAICFKTIFIWVKKNYIDPTNDQTDLVFKGYSTIELLQLLDAICFFELKNRKLELKVSEQIDSQRDYSW